MGEVAIVGGDLSVLSRWADAIRVAGRDSRLIAPGVLDREPVAFARYCLFDLGQRAAADPQPLLDAVAAHPGVGFVAMTSRPEAAEGLRLLRGGVRGYCNRLASPMVIQALLGAVAQGEIWAGREVTEYLLRPGAAAPARATPAAAISS